MKIKCLIVDDEPLAIDIIESYINRIGNIEIVAKCENAIKAFEILRQKSIDLIFLDIQMPKLTGIDFLKTLTNPPKVIFTTAYQDYAVEGFKVEAIDYLLKPFGYDEFLKSANKAKAYFDLLKKASVRVEEKEEYLLAMQKNLSDNSSHWLTKTGDYLPIVDYLIIENKAVNHLLKKVNPLLNKGQVNRVVDIFDNLLYASQPINEFQALREKYLEKKERESFSGEISTIIEVKI